MRGESVHKVARSRWVTPGARRGPCSWCGCSPRWSGPTVPGSGSRPAPSAGARGSRCLSMGWGGWSRLDGGGNGSVKSTLDGLMNGLVVPSTGPVLVDGMDTARDGAGVRRKVAFVFSDPDAQIVMPTVAEDVAFSLRRHGLSKKEVADRVRDVLARYGLGGHADHPAHLLSSGQKQLLALASVLVTEPEVRSEE